MIANYKCNIKLPYSSGQIEQGKRGSSTVDQEMLNDVPSLYFCISGLNLLIPLRRVI